MTELGTLDRGRKGLSAVGGKKKDGQKLTPVKSPTLVFCEEFHWVKKDEG